MVTTARSAQACRRTAQVPDPRARGARVRPRPASTAGRRRRCPPFGHHPAAGFAVVGTKKCPVPGGHRPAHLLGDHLSRRLHRGRRPAPSAGPRPTRRCTRSSTTSSGRSAPTSTAVGCTRRWSTGRPRATAPDEHPVSRDFAAIWRAADKVVYSRTLRRPERDAPRSSATSTPTRCPAEGHGRARSRRRRSRARRRRPRRRAGGRAPPRRRAGRRRRRQARPARRRTDGPRPAGRATVHGGTVYLRYAVRAS